MIITLLISVCVVIEWEEDSNELKFYLVFSAIVFFISSFKGISHLKTCSGSWKYFAKFLQYIN